jgi:antitoxin component YwqK of YwqJK toxin-antitoxin module
MMKRLVIFLSILFVLIEFTGCGVYQSSLSNNYPNGQPRFKGNMTTIGATKDGPWVYYFENGKIQSEGSYKLNKMDGLWTWYYPSGAKCKQQEFTFNMLVEPNPNGPYQKWSEEGATIIKGQFSNSRKTGLWEFWTTSDVKIIEIEYTDNLPNGQCTMWYSIPQAEGKKKMKCRFINGKHNESYKAWYPNGILMCEATLTNGTIVDVQLYDQDGSGVSDKKKSQERLSKFISSDIELIRDIEKEI